MSEGSLPPFGLFRPRSLSGAAGRALGRIFGRPKRRMESAGPDPALNARAASAVRQHAEEHATLFERAERLTEKARRLQEAGTPSESADNRAARAGDEVRAGLAVLRDRFAASEGGSGGEALDREVGRRYPALGFGQDPYS